jgi:hypothetical protein
MRKPADLTVYCTPQLRTLWPDPLAGRWREEYPNIFDDDDVRLTGRQRRNHFCEWFAAICLFHSRGVLSLVEKYRRGKAHPCKREPFERLFSVTERRRLNEICADCSVQPPDQLIYTPAFTQRGFVEVKGPGDRLSEPQLINKDSNDQA